MTSGWCWPQWVGPTHIILTQDNLSQVWLWANSSRVALSSQVTLGCVYSILNINQDTEIKPWSRHSGDKILLSTTEGKAAVSLSMKH